MEGTRSFLRVRASGGVLEKPLVGGEQGFPPFAVREKETGSFEGAQGMVGSAPRDEEVAFSPKR
jgi:hypothetical protein